eukprot:4062419-Alexandrium_andersonii.AAC.1
MEALPAVTFIQWQCGSHEHRTHTINMCMCKHEECHNANAPSHAGNRSPELPLRLDPGCRCPLPPGGCESWNSLPHPGLCVNKHKHTQGMN